MKKMLLAVMLSSASVAAVAQDRGFYAGGHIGQASVEDFCDGVGGGGVSCDDKDTAWRVLGGYQVNRNFAVEIGYTDLGEVRVSGPGGTVSVEATAFEAVAVGMLPVADRFSVYGKIGLYRGDTEASASTVLITQDFSETNTDLTFGIGLRFDLGARFAVRAEWQRYQDIGGGDIGEADVDVISVGFLVRF